MTPTSRPRLLRRALALAGALLLSLGGVGVAGLAGVSAQTSPGPSLTSFDAAAGADGVRVGVFITGFPLVNQVVDVGAPSAQAVLNGIGKSQAYAAMPYPGDDVLTLPGTVFPVLGLPSPPPYPLIASSDASTSPQAAVNQPGLSLSAKSDPGSSTATATAGGGAGVGSAESTATTKVDGSTGAVTAVSDCSADVVSLQGVLRIGHVEAKAHAAQGIEGTTLDSSFSAEGVSVAGVSVSVSDKGIVLPGGSTPVPNTSGLSPVLDKAGVSMKVLPVEKHEHSIVAGGLVVSVNVPAPTGSTIVSYTFGRASASATGSVEPRQSAADTGAGALTGGTEPAAATGGAPTAGESGFSAPLASTAPPLSSGPTAAPRTSTRAQPGGARRGAVTLAGASSSTTSAASFYLVLVVGAVVAASGLVLVRLFGVKLLWT